MSSTKNPYIVLGLDYGASTAAATRAFARKSRQLRSGPDSVYGLDDLTWALHQIEQVNTEPDSALGIYRIPSHADGFTPPAGEGLLSVHSPPLARQSPASTDSDRREAHQQVLREAMNSLISGWPSPRMTVYGYDLNAVGEFDVQVDDTDTGADDRETNESAWKHWKPGRVPPTPSAAWAFGKHIEAERAKLPGWRRRRLERKSSRGTSSMD